MAERTAEHRAVGRSGKGGRLAMHGLGWKVARWVVGVAVVAGGMGWGGGVGWSGVAAGQVGGGGSAVVAAGYDAHTEPCKRSKLNFAAPGVLIEVLVKEGERVTQGQPLARLDDRADRRLFESLEMEGKSTLKIEAAEADLKQKKIELERKKKSFEGGGAAQTEVDEAEINVTIRALQVQIEELGRKQKELEAARQLVKVEQMTVTAPFDGTIEKIDLQLGETPDQQKPAIMVVKNDVLYVGVSLPTGVALKLKSGDELDVRYKDLGTTVKGKVIFLSPFADAASETRLVRLEVPNGQGLPAGLAVSVSVPEAISGRSLADAQSGGR